MSIKLSDTQLVMLSAAAQRDDRCLTLPEKLKGGAAHKVATKLIAAGLVEEVKAKAGMPVWRRDEQDGQSYALRLTAAGAKAIAVNPDDDASPASDEERSPPEGDQPPTSRRVGSNRRWGVRCGKRPGIRDASRAAGRVRSWRRRSRCFEQPKERRSANWRKRWVGCRTRPTLS